MDTARKNEIAYAFLKDRTANHGMEIGNDFRRSVGRVAKQTGIPFAEALEFSTNLASEILKEASDVGRPPNEDELEGHGGGH